MTDAVASAVAFAHRSEWAAVLAATVRVTRDIDLAEECVQDAYARALHAWRTDGIPTRPGAWLTTVARRRALDLIRREQALVRRLPLLVEPVVDEMPVIGAIPDDRLRLVFTCCHPALAPETQVALTLRLVCGLSTAEVARAFLVSEATMAARITRGKKKIQVARIPYRVPSPTELPERIPPVLAVAHLVFTTGHAAPIGDRLHRPDLVERALDLTRMLRSILPTEPAIVGLLALFLLTDARRPARVDDDGAFVSLADQDRTLWDTAAITEGLELFARARDACPDDHYVLMAAIAAVHARATTWDDTDWDEIVTLYDRLVERWHSPVVRMNRAVAVSFAAGANAGLDALDALRDEPLLAGYSYYAAARADLLRQLGRTDEARIAYEEALLLTENLVEARYLRTRVAELAG
jgi:RNA polymerase sigma factor (sigma-70 family)